MKISADKIVKKEDEKAVNIYCGGQVKIQTEFKFVNPFILGFWFTIGVFGAIGLLLSIIKLLNLFKI